ncbi:hypothetical protein SAMN02745866_02087 [Alteromonadaceae bacterium Bs31]|nr:hypothetical protein SAMN02745866_02087 [Alteromonadaceae bacterium Bs31]
MVDSIRPTHPSMPSSSARRDQSTHSVESHTDQKQHQNPVIPKKPVKERRKNSDRRRNERDVPRAIYELRSGKDRRKGDGNHPTIEIDV